MDLTISRLQLRAGRALAGLSIADVARMIGVTAPTVCKLERDPPEGRVATLAAVIAAIESRGVRFVPGGAVLEKTLGTVERGWEKLGSPPETHATG